MGATASYRRGEDGVEVASFNDGDVRNNVSFSAPSGEAAPQLKYAVCHCCQRTNELLMLDVLALRSQIGTVYG